MSQPTANLEASVVAICDGADRIIGTGFIVAERLILTCAHVVEEAGGRPGGSVIVRLHASGDRRQAHVSAQNWQPSDGDDIAVLQLDADLPAGVMPVVLGNAEGSDGHSFRAFGYPPVGNVEGIFATGKIEGLVREAGRQLIQLTSQNLAQGISGAPVRDEERQQVIGMVTSVYRPDVSTKHRDTAFATPVATLSRTCPGLRISPAQPLSLQQAEFLLDSGAYREAAQLLREIVKRFPENPHARLLYAFALLGGRSPETLTSREIMAVEAHVSHARQHAETHRLASVVLVVIKHDYYISNGMSEGTPPLKQLLDEARIESLSLQDRSLLKHLKATRKAKDLLSVMW